MKTIQLTKGMVALVDDSDFDFINQWNWYASQSNGNFYARRDERVKGRRRRIFMHRVLSGAAEGQYVDHEDRCTLNNQRKNLRKTSQVNNMGNCGMQSHNTSGFKGVSWDKEKRRWLAQIRSKDGKRQFLGRFISKQEAAVAYDSAAMEKHGEFALTNRKLGLL